MRRAIVSAPPPGGNGTIEADVTVGPSLCLRLRLRGMTENANSEQ